MSEREWMNAMEAAEYLGVTDRTIRNYMRRGHLPSYSPPGSRIVRIDRADLDALLVLRPSHVGESA